MFRLSTPPVTSAMSLDGDIEQSYTLFRRDKARNKTLNPTYTRTSGHIHAVALPPPLSPTSKRPFAVQITSNIVQLQATANYCQTLHCQPAIQRWIILQTAL